MLIFLDPTGVLRSAKTKGGCLGEVGCECTNGRFENFFSNDFSDTDFTKYKIYLTLAFYCCTFCNHI